MNVWAFDNPVAIEAALSADGAKAWRADIGKWVTAILSAFICVHRRLMPFSTCLGHGADNERVGV